MTIVADRSVSGKTETEGQLHRAIDWRGAFWVASGVPALVLFSIGGIAGVAGKLASRLVRLDGWGSSSPSHMRR